MVLPCMPALLRAEDVTFRNISDNSGSMLDMTVGTIMRDSDGYVWLGNGLGVDRFDGLRLKHYPIGGADTKVRRVNALATAGSPVRVFAGNGDGLWELSAVADSFCPALSDSARMSMGAVNALSAVTDGVLALGTSTGLYEYDIVSRNVHNVPLVDRRRAAPSNHINDIASSGDTLFLATDAGMVVLCDSLAALYDFDVPFMSVASTPSRVFLGTSDRGLYTFDRRTGALQPYRKLDGDVITDIAARGDCLYVATDGTGVYVVDTVRDSVMCHYTHSSGHAGSLNSNAVYAVYVDEDNLLWLGYYQLGASYTPYSADLFSTYSVPGYTTAGRAVRVVRQHAPYTLIGTRDGVVIVDDSTDPPKVSRYERPELRSNMIISATWYRDHFVVGTYGGGMQLIYPAEGEIRDNSASEDWPFRRGHVFSLTSHPGGSLWVGTSAGLYRYNSDDSKQRSWTSDNSQLPAGNIYAIFFDSRGNGWICTENGLAVYDPATDAIRGNVFPKGFFNDRKFKDVFEDSRGRLYFLPEHGPVCVTNIDMTEFGRLDTPGFGELEPRAIIEDRDGCLWLSASSGIFCRARDSQEWTEYGSTDGVVSPLFINCTPVADESGRLWFGNSAGLLVVDPGEVHERRHSSEYSLVPAEVSVNGRTISPSHITVDREGVYNVRISCHAASITLHLTPLNFSDPANLHYLYSLDGDGEWHDLDRDFDLSFYNLAGGRHTIRLIQAGRPDTLTLIHVHVPYPTWLWICVIALLVAGMALAGLVWQRRRHRKEPLQNSIQFADAVDEEETSDSEETVAEKAARKYKTYTMREEEGREIAALLNRVMNEEKPYTNPELRLADLADQIGVSGHRLSFYFNQYLHQTFYDYVNHWRVGEFKRLAASPQAARFTLSALSSKAGFSSRTSFFRYFKKAEGITPAEYIERLKDSDLPPPNGLFGNVD